jgi:NCAIR mutase (PurE)-related protein
VRDILQALADGSLSVEEAEKRLKLYAVHELEGLANLDLQRSARIGRPEIVRCRGKSVQEAVALALPFLDEVGTVILSDATDAHAQALRAERPAVFVALEERAGLLVAKRPDVASPEPIGTIAVITAGTSDLPIAAQVQVIAEALGARVRLYPDVGISGLHRLFPVVRQVVELDPEVIVVIAGQEGGLAPVLAGLMDIPIVGVPTSVGTGFGGQGIAALSTMLQSCSLGMAVVNIDNGIAAGVVAAAIARRVARGSSAKGR